MMLWQAGIYIMMKRIGWEDADCLCIAGYNEVSDKEGFEAYFGGKYDHPLCIGMFATKY